MCDDDYVYTDPHMIFEFVQRHAHLTMCLLVQGVCCCLIWMPL